MTAVPSQGPAGLGVGGTKTPKEVTKIKRSNQYYINVLEDFIKYYENTYNEYIKNHKGEFSSFYLNRWYEQVGKQEFHVISKLIYQTKLDRRSEAFAKLYRNYIDSAIEDRDDTLILENLFAVPSRMREEIGLG